MTTTRIRSSHVSSENTPLDESDAQSEQDEQSEETLPARRPKKKQMRPIHVPKWQAGGMAKLYVHLLCDRLFRPRQDSRTSVEAILGSDNLIRRLSSDDDDGDTEIIVEVGVEDVSHAKRKRERSRSRSITPPPALSAHQLANAKDLVRCVVTAFVPLKSLTPYQTSIGCAAARDLSDFASR